MLIIGQYSVASICDNSAARSTLTVLMADITPALVSLVILVCISISVTSVDVFDNHLVKEIETNNSATPKSRAIHDFHTHTSAYKTLDSKDTKCYLERMYQKIDAVPKKDTHSVLFTTHKLLTKQEVFVLGGPRILEFCRAIPTFLLQHRTAYWQREEQVIAYKTLEDAKCFIVNMPVGQNFNLLNSTNFMVSSSIKLSKQSLWNWGGSKIVEFCNGFTSYALQSDSDSTQLNMINEVPITTNKLRKVKKRNVDYKLKSQTQSQYLNIGGTNQEPGKAEAEATRDGTKAVVLGSSGMGQAQSQSNPWSCEDCYGYPLEPGRMQVGTGYGISGQPGTVPSQGTPYAQTGTTGALGSLPIGAEGSEIYGGRPGDIVLGQFGQSGIPGISVRPGQPGFGHRTQQQGTPGTYYRPDDVIAGTPNIYPGVPGGQTPGTFVGPDSTQIGHQPGGPGGIQQTVPGVPGYPGAYGRPGIMQIGQPAVPGSYYDPPGPKLTDIPGMAIPRLHGIPAGAQPGQPGAPGTLGKYPTLSSQIIGLPGTPGIPEGIYTQGTPGYPGPYGAPGRAPFIYPGRDIPAIPGVQRVQPGTPATYGRPGSPGAYETPGVYIPGTPGVGHPGFTATSTIPGGYTSAPGPPYYRPSSGIGQMPVIPSSTFVSPGAPGVIYGSAPQDVRYPQEPGLSGQPGLFKPSIGVPVSSTQYPRGTATGTVYPQAPSGLQLPGQSIISRYDHEGDFTGKLSGDYHTNEHRGQFSGLISGQYTGRGRATTAESTGTGPTGTGPSATADYPTTGKTRPSEIIAGGHYAGTEYPGTRPQTYGEDIIYPRGPSHPGITAHPDHELIPGVQYPGRQTQPAGISRPAQGYQPGQYHPGTVLQPGPYYPPQISRIGDPGDVYTPGTPAVRPTEYIPGQRLIGAYIPGQHEQAGLHIGSIPTPGIYDPLQGLNNVYVPGRGQVGIPETGPAGIPGVKPGAYIPGIGSAGVYTPGIVPDGTFGLPGEITGAGDRIPGLVTQIYIPGQGIGPAGSDTERYIPGTQLPDGRGIPGTYIPGHGYIGQPGIRPGVGRPGEHIAGQRTIGPVGLVPGEYIPGQLTTGSRPLEQPGIPGGYQIPGGFIPGQTQTGTSEISTGGGISYRPGDIGVPGAYFGQPGLFPGDGYSTAPAVPTGGLPGQQGIGQIGVPGYPIIGAQIPGQYIRPGQGELLPGAPDYVSGAAKPDDDSDSQVQTSVKQLNNETQASASSQGKYLGGTAQSQVSGTYSGSGSFSASAGTIDKHRGTQTQVSGGAEGAMSSAQGRGGAGQSQAQVQLGSKTGDTTSSAQSGGINHGTNTQVQAGGKGGMADAQANGKGSTSSQANIGFLPHDPQERGEDNGSGNPFGGGGTASAQSGANVGQSQAQLNGKYRFGIKYTGNAQASSSNDGKNLPLRNISSSQIQDFKLFNFNKPTFPTISTTQPPLSVTTLPVPTAAHSKRNVTTTADYSEEEDGPDEEFEEEYIETESQKKVIIPINSQHTRAQRQYVSLGELEDLDATVIQATHEDSVYEPGQMVPGTEFAIPAGLRGRVISTSGQDTYAQGSNSQAQTIHLNPGTGEVTYMKPPIYAVTSNTHLRNGQGYGSGYTYQPHQYQLRNRESYPRFVSSTRSETGSKNIITGKKTPSVYYSQSSTCGYFTSSCVFSNGKKVCIPKPKLNPDGTPMIC